MKAKGGTWTIDDLNKFIDNPKGFVPGTAMGFAGIQKDSERADVIAYLNTLSDSPRRCRPRRNRLSCFKWTFSLQAAGLRPGRFAFRARPWVPARGSRPRASVPVALLLPGPFAAQAGGAIMSKKQLNRPKPCPILRSSIAHASTGYSLWHLPDDISCRAARLPRSPRPSAPQPAFRSSLPRRRRLPPASPPGGTGCRCLATSSIRPTSSASTTSIPTRRRAASPA